jgi:hypothetical protein
MNGMCCSNGEYGAEQTAAMSIRFAAVIRRSSAVVLHGGEVIGSGDDTSPFGRVHAGILFQPADTG